jgi:mono/diheme cytochrome c family protein
MSAKPALDRRTARQARRPAAGAAALACALGLGLGAAPAAAGDAGARAQLNYLQHCVGCHGVDGGGAPSKGIPTMRGNLGRFLQVPGGREFIVQVPGVMNTSLADRDIAELMNWLLPRISAATLPPGLRAYSEPEIARLRSTRPADFPATRRSLVEAMRSAGIAFDDGAKP